MKVPLASAKGLHVSAKQDYPLAEILPLPLNVDPSEATVFSPQRARDITSTVISTNVWNQRTIDITIDSTHDDAKLTSDPHVGSYDCQNAVSLNSSMQSNVPSPFGGMHKFTHLNMPGGQWSQNNKWMSHGLNASHYINLRLESRKNWSSDATKNANVKGRINFNRNACLHGKYTTLSSIVWNSMRRSHNSNAPFACTNYNYNALYSLNHLNAMPNHVICRKYSDKKEIEKTNGEKDIKSVENIESTGQNESKVVTLTPREKLKKTIKDYGLTVFVFHVAISLVSLGLFYQLVSR